MFNIRRLFAYVKRVAWNEGGFITAAVAAPILAEAIGGGAAAGAGKGGLGALGGLGGAAGGAGGMGSLMSLAGPAMGMIGSGMQAGKPTPSGPFTPPGSSAGGGSGNSILRQSSYPPEIAALLAMLSKGKMPEAGGPSGMGGSGGFGLGLGEAP